MATHIAHDPPELRLDVHCPACQEKTVAGLDDTNMMIELGMDRDTFDRITDPTYKGGRGMVSLGDVEYGQAILFAFRYAIRGALALKVRTEIDELKSIGRWPL